MGGEEGRREEGMEGEEERKAGELLLLSLATQMLHLGELGKSNILNSSRIVSWKCLCVST
jgi:hypothetical protein